ncbi:MAG: thioredoxin family protein [Phycisphaerales bacterium]|nr:MAG: thioredoxin family protein [Phycisphaerales bacterium]
MKRTLTCLGVILTALTLVSAATAQPGAEPRPNRPPLDPAQQRRGAEGQRQALQIRRQLADLKASHETLIADLKALHATAVKEEAAATAEAIEKLIAKRQQAYQNQVTRLEERDEALAKAMRERTQRMERRGRRAPQFELDSFDGRTVSLSQYKGRVVVLEWFNMDCPFSKYHYETKPTMVDLAKKYQDKEVVWLAINSTSSTGPEANRAFAKQYKLPFPILDDRSGRVGRAYGARTTPHLFVIDKRGNIVYNGAIDSSPMGKVVEGATPINYVDQALAAVLAGREVATPATAPYGCSVKYGR